MTGIGRSDAAAELRDLLRSDAFRGVLSVVHDGEPVLEHAAGRENGETGEPITRNTRFAVASFSKMFTAVCLARLVDRGLCRLGQPLGEVVPRLAPHFGPDVTLESLLSHRAGLGDYLDDDSPLPFARLDVARLDHTAAFLPAVLEVPRLPAGEFHYSSAGFILLGLAIEELTGRPYREAVQEEVIGPAGLAATGFPRLDRPTRGLAVGILADGRPNHGHLPPLGGADGGIVTTVADLRRFFAALRTGELLADGTRRLLWTDPGSDEGATAEYGHGFDLRRACGQDWFGHTGSDPGISARAAAARDIDSSVIVLCNRDAIAFRAFRLAFAWLEEEGLPPDRPLTVAPARPTLFSARLRGEPVEKEHAAAMADMLADGALYRFLADRPPSREELERQYGFLEGGRSPDGREHWLTWILRPRGAPDEPIGFVQATIREPETAHVAYVVASTHQRRGYAREALAALLTLVFDRYRVARAVAEMDTRNEASIGLVETLGFRRVGTVRGADEIDGVPSDEHRYEITTSEWDARQARRQDGDGP